MLKLARVHVDVEIIERKERRRTERNRRGAGRGEKRPCAVMSQLSCSAGGVDTTWTSIPCRQHGKILAACRSTN